MIALHSTVRAAALALALPLFVTAPTGALASPAASLLAGETCDGHAATIVAKPSTKRNPPPVMGTAGDDVIVGTEEDDVIDGRGGNDIICGLAGSDEIRGGPGNDRLFGGLDWEYTGDDDYFGDRIEPGPGDDYIDLGHDPVSAEILNVDIGYWDQLSYRHGDGPVTVDLAAGTATGEGTDTIAPIVYAAGIEGSDFGDHLSGTDGPDWILAGGGDDVIEGRAGFDIIDADADRFEKHRPGNDVVSGGADEDWIDGGFGNDLIHGDEGNDAIGVQRSTGTKAYGDAGDDWIGGDGFRVPSGRVTLFGGPGDDAFTPDLESTNDRVVVRGGPGRNTLRLDLSYRLVPQGARLEIGTPTGTYRMDGHPLMRFSSVDVHRIDADSIKASLTWRGTQGADILRVIDLDGPVRAYGRGGDDLIRTSRGKDFLDGGAGRDLLDGGTQRDRCVHGEKYRSCEARR